MSDPLLAVLREHQRLGFLGKGPVEASIEHAEWLVEAIEPSARVLDLGSGGGLPGLVLLARRADLQIVLLDVRQRRTDALRRAVARLGGADRALVVQEDVARAVRGPLAAAFDVVTARSFGPLGSTLGWSARLVRTGGTVYVSRPPTETTRPTVDGLVWTRDVGPWAMWRRADPAPASDVPRETST